MKRPKFVAKTGIAKLKRGSMVLPADVTSALASTPGAAVAGPEMPAFSPQSAPAGRAMQAPIRAAGRMPSIRVGTGSTKRLVQRAGRPRMPRFAMGSYSVESDGPAVVDQGETILDPNAASTVRDAGTPTSGPVNGGTSFGLAGSGASFGISGLPNFYGGSGAADQGASLPSFDGSSAFGQGANGMSYQSILPTFLGNTMTNLPNPNQIVARNWMKLDPGTQDLFKAAYEQQGYSPEYIDWQIKQILPKAGFGAAPRSQGRIMR